MRWRCAFFAAGLAADTHRHRVAAGRVAGARVDTLMLSLVTVLCTHSVSSIAMMSDYRAHEWHGLSAVAA
jgi:hypothetical protein